MGMPAPVAKDDDEFLAVGTKLFNDAYTITGHLGGGGFGLTYMATDGLNREIVIKECYPRNLCWRPEMSISIRSRAYQHDYERVVANFVREARALAQLRHPNITSVLQLFEENDTAYMAMEFVEGSDLSRTLKELDGPMEPKKVINITKQLLEALDYVHSKDILHRDIAPDNIIIQPDGTPLLIDFGAARGDGGKVTRLLSEQLAIVKDGYSPQEFYIQGSQQTPASDLYALGATLYHAVTGKAPTDCNLRMMAVAQEDPDPVQPLAGTLGGYPKGFLEALDKAMSIFPAQRHASAQEWLDMMDEASAPLPKSDAKNKAPLFAGLAALAAAGAGAFFLLSPTQDAGTSTVPATQSVPPVIASTEVAKAETPTPQNATPAVTAAIPPAVETEPTAQPTSVPVAAEPVEPQISVLAPTESAWEALTNLTLIPRNDAEGNAVLVFLGASTNPYPDGTELVSVAGQPVPADPDDLAGIMTAYLNQTDPETPVVPLTIRDALTGQSEEVTLTIDARKAAAFPGFALTQLMERGKWSITVSASDASPFFVGDKLLSERNSNTSFTSINHFSETLQGLAASGQDTAIVLINREGQTLSVDLPIQLD